MIIECVCCAIHEKRFHFPNSLYLMKRINTELIDFPLYKLEGRKVLIRVRD